MLTSHASPQEIAQWTRRQAQRRAPVVHQARNSAEKSGRTGTSKISRLRSRHAGSSSSKLTVGGCSTDKHQPLCAGKGRARPSVSSRRASTVQHSPIRRFRSHSGPPPCGFKYIQHEISVRPYAISSLLRDGVAPSIRSVKGNGNKATGSVRLQQA